MKKILLMLFVIIAAPNCIKAQFKFSLTPDKIITGKSKLISNCVEYFEYYQFDNWYSPARFKIKGEDLSDDKIWSEKQNRKYNIKYERYFKDFYIEEIGTSRKIVLIKPNGEIMKDFRELIITSTEKIIGFSKENDKFLFFDIQLLF